MRACDPFSISTCLVQFDNAVHLCLESITGSALSPSQRLQCSLPVAKAGLGLPVSPSIAPVAFLGCYIDIKYLSDRIFQNTTVPSTVLNCYRPPPSFSVTTLTFFSWPPKAQMKLSSLLDSKFLSELMSSASTPRDRARLLTCLLPNSGDWLSAVPLKALGLTLPAAEFRFAVWFRLGVPLLSSESTCPKFSRTLDTFGCHALACAADGDRISRNDRLRDVVFNSAAKAALSPVLEKANLTSSRSRPGDTYLPCWYRGRPAALDMTVISSLQSSTLQSAGTSAGHALELSDERKVTKHFSACEEAAISFVPLSVEAFGGWSPIAAKTIRRIASMAAAHSACTKPGQTACYLMQQLSVVLQKGNSTLLLSRYCS